MRSNNRVYASTTQTQLLTMLYFRNDVIIIACNHMSKD